MELPTDYTKLTPQERRQTREEYVRRQKGLCTHCGAPLSGPAAPAVLARSIRRNLFPPDFFKWPVHLHHSHETGMTIGAIHSYCNAILWQYHGE
jgi:hypothetical protein